MLSLLFSQYLVATVGTTSSGAVDNITEIAQILKSTNSDVWLHIDAAWAGIALVCPEYHDWAHLPAINQHAHSFCTNLHKWGLTNFDASTLWVRNRRWLNDALDITPEFLRTAHSDAGTVIDYRNWHLALGRRFRSLKVWFVLRSFGAEGFRKVITRHVELSNKFVELVKGSKLLTVVATPSLALTVFRLDPTNDNTGLRLSQSDSLESLNALNTNLHKRLSARTDIILTQTSLNGMFCIRLAVGSLYTDESHIEKAFKLVSDESELTLKELTNPN
jgi:aromatic-L-amino-acid decarboxylase